MNTEELAFYDAIEVIDSAVKMLGEPTLQQIARELVESVLAKLSIDWTIKESVWAKFCASSPSASSGTCRAADIPFH